MRIFLKLDEIVEIHQLKEIIIILEWLGETNVNESRARMIMVRKTVGIGWNYGDLQLGKLLSPWIGWAELSDNEARGKGDNSGKPKDTIELPSTVKEREKTIGRPRLKAAGMERSGMAWSEPPFENKELFVFSRSILALLDQPENLVLENSVIFWSKTKISLI